MVNFYDGHYFVEDVIAARISNYLSHQGVHLSDSQTEEISRVVIGAMMGYMIGTDDLIDFLKVREEKLNPEKKED